MTSVSITAITPEDAGMTPKPPQKSAPGKASRSRTKLESSIIIMRDTREQAGYTFGCIRPQPTVMAATLLTGDYSLRGFEDKITVERKSSPDAFGSFGKDRARFERELARLATFEFAAVVIEADWLQIIRRPPKFSRLNPKTVLASVVAWQQRHGVHFWACPDRIFAEKITFRLLERYWQDQQKYGDTAHDAPAPRLR